MLDLNTDQILYVSPAFEIVWGRSCESLYADPLIADQKRPSRRPGESDVCQPG